MHLFINSLAASAGGGLTYIRNVIPILAGRPELQVTVAAGRELCREFGSLSNVRFLELDIPGARRFWYEQFVLPGVLRQSGADVLLSAGNFALRNSPVPQILLSRNSIYTSPDFYQDLLARHEYRMWLETRLRGALAKKSVRWADVTVAPSAAFAEELRRWTGASNIVAIHHGFDHESFMRDATPLSAEVSEKLHGAAGSLKLLFVSHYNYYRNFETLIRALPILRARLKGRRVTLLLTCKLLAGENPGSYRTEAAQDLIRELGISDMVVQLGAIPYRQLHQVYSQADIYVTPAYTETFAHPLVEAMACGVPIVAADLPVHREICGDAAVYFPRFSPDALAECAVRLLDPPLATLRATGRRRFPAFSWAGHVEEVLKISGKLTEKRCRVE